MDRTHAILLVFILQIKCKAQDPCNGNYMTLDPIRIGNRVDLACGCPSGTTTVAWYRDNFNNQTTTITDIYIVNVLSETDGGYYICRCDAHSNCFLLKVHNQITLCQIEPTYVPIGGTMMVYCGAIGYPPPSACYLIVPGMDMQVTVPLNGSLGVWTHSNVTLNNTGIYTCFVNDESGYDQQMISAITYEQPQIVLFNYSLMQQSAMLTCYISCHSTPCSVTFLHNNTVLDLNQTVAEYSLPNSSSTHTGKYTIEASEQSGGDAKYTLTIANFLPDDFGQYTCEVGSEYRPVEQQQKINISAFIHDTTASLQVSLLPVIVFISGTPSDNVTASTPATLPYTVLLAALIPAAVILIGIIVVVVLFSIKLSQKKCGMTPQAANEASFEMKQQ